MRRLRVLGPLEVDGAAEVLGPRDRVVVSALALRPGERVDAETLAEALWGEQPPASAAKVVQGCVSRLRRALGAEAIETVDGGYRVRYDELDIDRQQFEDLVERARGYLAMRTPERAIPLLAESLALWRGPAFGELEEWTPGRLEAVRLGQLRLAAEEDLLQARLDAGDHAGVATDGTVLTGQQPFRERRWALLALAQYRSGRQADALASIRSARRALGQELGLDPGSELVALESRILAQDPGLATDHEARLADASCPWKGLAPYDDRDADTFFGRDADIAACLARLEESPLLVVTGPSGSGKSSLVQAGLVPALRAGGADVEVFTPGADGALAMAAARSRHPGDPLLVIDQFEEAFTLRGAAYARPWLGDLARYAEESGPVVVVVRGDHMAELGADVDLARLAERGLHLVAPLTAERLREAVEGPATVAGLRFEPGLVDLVVRDADGQPGALPLLSHALAETWQRREGGLLTVDGYRAAGGIREAVAASAERLYDGLSAAERTELRWLLLRLVSLSENGEPFRTPLPASVAVALDPVRRRLLDLLVRGRLVTSRDGGYDLAHEALVRAWPRLRAWLDEDRVGQQIRRHLTMSAAGWDALDRPEGELYRGARLGAALEWLDRGDEPLADTERDFIDASRAVADNDVRRLAAESRRQRRQNRRLRLLVAGAAVLLVVSTVAGGLALDRGREANRGRDAAASSAASARHESLVALSLSLRPTNRALAALLAVKAFRDSPDTLAESALFGSLTSTPGFLGYHYLWLGNHTTAADVPGANTVLVARGTHLLAINPNGLPMSAAVFNHQLASSTAPTVIRVSADGSRAVQLVQTAPGEVCAGSCAVLVVYDIRTRTSLREPLVTPFRNGDVAISRRGDLVAVADTAGSGAVITWDVSTGRRVGRLAVAGSAVAFGRRDMLYVGSATGPVHEVSARALRVLRTFEAPPRSANRRLIVAGDRLVAGGDRGQVVFGLVHGKQQWSVGPRDSGESACPILAVSTLLGRTYCASVFGEAVERDLATGQPSGRVLDPQMGAIAELVVTDSGHGLLAFVENQPFIARWQLDGPGVGGRVLAAGATSYGGYDPSGQFLLASRRGRTVVLDNGGGVYRPLSIDGRAIWLSSKTIGVLGGAPGRPPVLLAVHPEANALTTTLDSDVRALYPEAGGTHAWAMSRRKGTVVLQRFSLASGEAVGPSVSRPEADEMRLVSDGTTLLVTERNGGQKGEWATEIYDVSSGALVSTGLYQRSPVTIAPDGTVIVADERGQVYLHAAAYLSAAETAFTGARGAVSSLQVSSDGRRLAVTSPDQAVSVFDMEKVTRLGDPLQTDASAGVVPAWLRPDGGALITNTSVGVVEWKLWPQLMVLRACDLAGRNLTTTEWSTYFPGSAMTPLCPRYPVDPVPME